MAFSNHDLVPDSPTNNFATLNRLQSFASSHDELTISNGNLKGDVSTTADAYGLGFSTIQLPKSGKFYAEILVTYDGDGNMLSFGCVSPSSYNPTSNSFAIYSDATFSGILLHQYNQTVRPVVNGSLGTTISLSRTNTILGIVFDIDNSSMTGWYNNNQLTIASTGINYDNFVIAIESNSHASNRSDFTCNFGQDPTFGGASNLPTGAGDYDTDAAGNSTGGRFAFQPPTGALALCAANLPEMTPTVDDDFPQDYFRAVTYTGNGGTQSITGVGFQPDLVWIKMRDTHDGTNSYNHYLYDSVRGINHALQSNSANQEETNRTGLTSFNQNGFSLGTQAGENRSGNSFVSWCFRAGGNSNTFNINGTGYITYSALQTANTSLPASSTSGMIVPSGMSINTDAGFSIVKYTGNNTDGASLPHGLNQRPDFIMIKNLTKSAGDKWVVASVGDFNINNNIGDGNLVLNSTDQADGSSGFFTSTPTSNVIYLGGGSSIRDPVNTSYDYIAYCWHSVEGFSKFGSYTGNGSVNGPFVYCGFRPAFLIIKNSDLSGSHWLLYDNQRSNYNVINKVLFPASSAEENGEGTPGMDNVDFLSNGFKIRGNPSGTWQNGLDDKIIFMAFAEQPFKYANAR